MDTRVARLVEVAYALKPNYQDFRSFHVAAIFKKGRLISLAHNTKKTHPFTLGKYPEYINSKGVHAECLAIIRGGLEDYSRHDLFVLRIDNNGRLALSRPCCHCSILSSKLNMGRIFYTDDYGQFVQL